MPAPCTEIGLPSTALSVPGGQPSFVRSRFRETCGFDVRGIGGVAARPTLGFEIARLQNRACAPTLPAHRHDHFQVVFVTQGSGAHVIDWEIYPVRAGAVFTLAPANVHSWHAGPGDVRAASPQPRGALAGYALHFDAAFAAACASHEAQTVLLPPLFDAGHPCAHYVDAAQSGALLEVFSNLEREYDSQELGRTSALQAHFQLLLVALNRCRPRQRQPHGLTPAESLTRDFRALVEAHFRERLSVQDYAARLDVSEGHLCRIVRKQMGVTASDLVQERVVVEAKRALVHLDANIADIAASLGYDDPAYFARLFKKCTGQTPSEFRFAFDRALTAQVANGSARTRAAGQRRCR